MSSVPTAIIRSEVDSASRLLTLVAAVVFIAGLYYGRAMLVPLALAALLSFLLAPIVAFLGRCYLPHGMSVVFTMVVAVGLIGLAGWQVTNQLVAVLVQLPDYKANLHKKVTELRTPGNGEMSRVVTSVDEISHEIELAANNAVTQRAAKQSAHQPIAVQVAEQPRTASEYVSELVGPLTGIVESSLIVAVLTLFLLLKQDDIRNRLLRLGGSGKLETMTRAMSEASARLGRYLILQWVVNLGYGLVFGLIVYAIHMPHPFLWAMLACFLRFIPYIGPPVGALLPAFVAFAVFPGWMQAFIIIASFVGLEVITANVVEPLLYGSHTGISPLAVLVSAVFWGMLWGPLGLILSTPMMVCVILMGRYVPQLNFIEILLGDAPPLHASSRYYQRLLVYDDEDARNVLSEYLSTHNLDDLYDRVLIPALSLAERDRRGGVIEAERATFICATTTEVIEEYEGEVADVEADDKLPRAMVLANKNSDTCAAAMAAHVLRQSGWDVTLERAAEALTTDMQFDYDLICLSSLTPAFDKARREFCRELKRRAPRAQIVIGAWNYAGDLEKAASRLGTQCGALLTSLTQLKELAPGKERRSKESQPADEALEVDETATAD